MLRLPGNKQPAGHLAFSPDGTLLAVTGIGLGFRVFDAVSRKLLWALPKKDADYRLGAAAFSPAGRFVLRQWDAASVFDARTGAPAKPTKAAWVPPPLKPGWWLRFRSPDGRWLAEYYGNSQTDGRFVLRDRAGFKTAQALGTALPLPDPEVNEPVNSKAVPLAFHPTEPRLLVARHNTLHLIDLPSLRVRHSIPFDAHIGQQVAETHMAAFTPDGRRLLVVGTGRLVRVWDTSTWAEREAFDWKMGPLISVAVAPDGTKAAAGNRKGQVILWDLE